jgi:hypothetical protein
MARAPLHRARRPRRLLADVGHSDSLAHLRVALAERVLHHRLGDLDGAELRRRAPRAFTQEISPYVFETAHEHNETPLCGICYLSRLGDELENWAIFEPIRPRRLDLPGARAHGPRPAARA